MKILMEHEAKDLLEKYEIPTAKCYFCENEYEALTAAKKIGFPVVMKVASREIIHKSDVGGVKLNLNSEEDVKKAFDELMKIEKAEGVNVQPMLSPGIEVIVGVAENDQFGSFVMFGLGGIFAEVVKDVSFRLLPVSRKDAEEMVKEIKGYRILEGYRGKKGDVSSLVKLLVKINEVVENENILEMDLNPIFVYEKGYCVADARIVIGERKKFNYEPKNIDVFFNPKSVAVIGASREVGKPGNQVIFNLLKIGFNGKIYPVNPKAGTIYDLKAYSSIKDVAEDVDIAIIAIPSKFVVDAVKECVEKGVKGIIILSGGFSEGWNYGVEIEKKILEIAKKKDVKIIGPNTMGILDTDSNFTSFFSYLLKVGKGNIGIVAQSGAVANFSLLYLHHIGISKVIALGNTCDVNEIDATNFLASDPKTKAIGLYLEGFKNGRVFYEVLKNCKKPVVILKAGRTEAGKRSALSHTASISTSEEIFETACKQARVAKTRDFDEFIDTLKALALQPLPKGNRVGVIEPSGAECVMAADAVEEEGLKLAKYSEKSLAKLYKIAPEWHSVNNPLDLYPFVEKNGDEVFFEILRIFLEDENIDAIVSGIFIPSLVRVRFDLSWVKGFEKPILFTLKTEIEELMSAKKLIEQMGFPVYPTPERALRVLKHMLSVVK
ncbi:MAG: acetate--CoA ligase family protein [Archaeoglobaceae archaeon]|nr:acetate--CoA ligase family protein [Archaeoglobaceae archaeon]MCX8152483.1 acetate--CoA ligase family protein [Archaeoglobaceae archaeon]MDW8013702.1 acetate--CoA ligase family protein [Archaeoglobaceae archaeon]